MSALRLGLRLAFAGGREGVARLALASFGVAIGVTLILMTLTAVPALEAREQRLAWHQTGQDSAPTAPDLMLWLAADDHVRGQDLLRVNLAPLGPRPPAIPGLDRLPGPGEVAVSPALRDLLATMPSEELGDRLGGRISMIIGERGLAHPDELVAVTGRTPEELRGFGGAVTVRGVHAAPGSFVVTGFLKILVIVVAIGLLVPVLVFVGTVTRLSAARREQRLAAIRLVGATRGQITLLAVAETAPAVLAGIVLGYLGYLLGRPVAARLVTFDGARFFAADVAVPAASLVLVLVGVPLLAAASTAASLRRAAVSPLGVTRRAPRRAPTPWRALPVAVGAVALAAAGLLRQSGWISQEGVVIQVLVGVSYLLILVGLVIAGPWLCRVIAQLISAATGHVTALLAARRLAADPYAAFRAISGVVLATFVTTMFAGVSGSAAQSPPQRAELRDGVVEIRTGGAARERIRESAARLADSPDARGVLAVHRSGGTVAIACADLARIVTLSCPAGVTSLAGRPPQALASVTKLVEPTEQTATWPISALYVQTATDEAAQERVRTQAALLLPGSRSATRGDLQAFDLRQLRELEGGLRIATLFVLFVAGCALTVAVVDGLLQRRRPFSLLRVCGVRLAELRAVVLLEAAGPIIAATAGAAILGLCASYLLSRIAGAVWSAPDPGYALALGSGVLAALAMIASVLPLLGKLTEPTATRFE
ncbi:ABC transporter permease [Acrocarpospora macrocephala]|uniref:ABC3 transporter permease C-terminal domain-containing protein n=1 Tax=Acrocarpospora macrocephala TaxID=150177 RepID=A0A5M3WPN7_9ACTN|nr:FtsX-like permease family protein [Acrocarpospora macrocephala]GES11297.1 hypothetical protein Amac_048940 [Acrocarpospora macrocephala]